jgi:hypothetical protein
MAAGHILAQSRAAHRRACQGFRHSGERFLFDRDGDGAGAKAQAMSGLLARRLNGLVGSHSMALSERLLGRAASAT